jgi:hypothetical protein
VSLSGRLLYTFEIVILSALVLTTRCANYRDVFIGGNIYFTDADCYARMTRVRLCSQHPGLILRHHAFENFPQGTTPHTTAPLDYLILFLSVLFRPFSARSIDLAGAWVSPALAVLTGAFLCWWSSQMKFRFRWAMLLLFAISPILVHGTALGRPDHQSLAVALVTAAICSDWILDRAKSTSWSIVSGLAWGLAIWVTAYEPLVLLGLSAGAGLACATLRKWNRPVNNQKRAESLTISNSGVVGPSRLKWILCGAVLLCAFAIERRLPSLAPFVRDPIFRNWSNTIGELKSIPILNPIWLRWLGWLIVAMPLLFLSRPAGPVRNCPLAIWILLLATFCLTVWEARWAYFFAILFAMILPIALQSLRRPLIGWLLFVCSLWPILRDWDERLWPDEAAAARQVEQQHEAVELRELSLNLISNEPRPILAPWWLSPAIVYWSGQPAVAGSSHESLSGIADSARFFLSENPAAGREILERRKVAWVVSYDAERVEKNASAILGKPVPMQSLARLLDQRSTHVPSYLNLVTQNGTGKIFEVTNKW